MFLKKYFSDITLTGIATIIMSIVAPWSRLKFGEQGVMVFGLLIYMGSFILNINKIKLESIQRWTIFLFLCSALSAISYYGFSMEVIKNQFAAALIFLYIINKKEINVLNVVNVIIAAVFVWMYFNLFEYNGGGVRRYIAVQELFLDPNIVGVSFIIPTVLSISFISDSNRLLNKIVGIGFLGVTIVAVLLSGSRGVLLALMIASAIYYIKTSGSKNIRRLIYIAIAAVSVIFIFSLFSDLFTDELLSRFTTQDLEDSGGSGREELASRALTYMFEYDANVGNTFFGYGFGTAVDILGKGIHNTALDYLWGMGILGFILYCVVHVKIFKYCWRSGSAVSISCLIGTLMWSLTVSASDVLVYWAVLYACIAYAKNYKQNNSKI